MFNVRQNHSLRPEWQDEIVLNDDYVHFLRKNVVFLFELLDLDDVTRYSCITLAAIT